MSRDDTTCGGTPRDQLALPDAATDGTRRDVLAGATAAALGTLLGGLMGAPAAAQQPTPAAVAATPIGTPWWPSRWGADDQAGASNHITPDKILETMKLIRQGKVHELGRIYESAMPKFGDRQFTLRIPGTPTGGPLGNNQVIWFDEYLSTEIGQVGTQFDGLGHIGVAVKGEDKSQMRFYNGLTVPDIASATGLKKLGIEHVKPIITRGWLFDIAAVKGRMLNLGEEITVADIQAAMTRQTINQADIKPGDALFFNTGWGSLWNKDNAQFGKGEPGIGLAAGQWCIDRQACVVGADTWGVEVVPNPDANRAFPVHQELIVKNGIFIHENLDFTSLTTDAVSSFAYLMMPLRIKGGTGSPGRPIAIV